MLEQLLEQKGILSRKIGEAKRDGLSIDGYLAEMKVISLEINRLKAEAKEQESAPLDSQTQQTTLKPKVKKPALFKAAKNTEVSGSPKVTVFNERDLAEWDQYVLSRSNSSIYHLSEFKKIVEKTFGHTTHYLIARDEANRVCGILPSVELKSPLFGHFIVSLPYFTYGGVLADSAEVADVLYTHLCSLAKEIGVAHIEWRATSEQPALEKNWPVKTAKVSMVRGLPDNAEVLWEDIGTKVRAQIKKAQRFDLKVVFGKSELLDDFYTVFAENMRDLGTPVYAKSFFAELMRSQLSEQFTLGVVYYKCKPVAVCFLMEHQGMMEVPWASALNSVNHMNVNMFMYWNILQLAIQNRNEFFDFGRSSKDAPTYRFKKQWGAKPQQLYWYYWLPEGLALPELNPNNPKYKLLITVWQKLPVWLTKWIGPPVVKYLP